MFFLLSSQNNSAGIFGALFYVEANAPLLIYKPTSLLVDKGVRGSSKLFSPHFRGFFG